MSPHQGTHPGSSDLPPELLELAAGRLLGVTPEVRARVLDELSRDHPGFETALRRLAGELAGAERLLEAGFAAPLEPLVVIGPYRVLRVIGEGAFGIVYLCAQEVPVRREVAVKVLRPGAGDRHTLARFEAERHVLATLSHPTVAQVFDAGALPDGRPYFVMEHVLGLPITSYCDQKRLGVDARLELFVRLCQGAHHAHQKGIVHRDLKPANILVYEQEGEPRPKIIDFGIAKALRATGDGSRSDSAIAVPASVRTDTGRVVGTPGYMSPEQSMGASGSLDARADVFSLGVILYELLTGELPWGPRPDSTDSEPPRPSLRVVSDATGDAARLRAIAPRKLASRLRGDLDWIVLMALARERERRYASAQELALDVGRHLNGEAVLAGPPALGYRLRKLARRHRVALAGAAAVVLASGLGLWFTLSFRAQARARAADVEAAADRLLARANDSRVIEAPRSDAVRKALAEDALRFYGEFLRERPADPKLREGRAHALFTLSQVHWLVGEFPESETVAQEASVEAEALLAADPDNLAHRAMLGNALRNVARAASSAGKREAARALFDRAVHELERCHAEAPSKYADLLVRALLDWGSATNVTELDDCARSLRRVVTILEETIRERASLAAKIDLLEALAALGKVLVKTNELQEAARLLRRADDLLEKTPEVGPACACRVLASGAALAGRKGNHGAAVSRLAKAIAMAERWSEQEPTLQRPRAELLELHVALADLHRASGDERAAALASRAAIAVGEARTARFPEDSLARGQLADHLDSFAMGLLNVGRRDVLVEAEAWMRRAIDLLATIPPSVDQRLRERARWLFRAHLGLVLDAKGSGDASAQWEHAWKAMTTWRERFGVDADDGAPFAEAALRVARHRLAAGNEAQADEVLDRLEALFREHPGASGPVNVYAAEAHLLRALLAARRGDDVRAAAEGELARATGKGWRGPLAGADALLAAWRAAQTAARAGNAEGSARAVTHRDRAIEFLRSAIAGLRTALAAVPGSPSFALASGQAEARLSVLLQDRGEREEARKLAEEALPGLAALRETAHANCWDEELYREAVAIAAR